MKATIKSLLFVLSFALVSCESSDLVSTSELTVDQLKSAAISVNDIATESVAEEVNFEANFYAEYDHLLRQLAKVKGRRGDLLAGRSGMHYQEGYAPIVSIDTVDTGYPMTITIEYGDSSITRNGRIISGTVTIEISAPKNTDGATRTITYSNCVIDKIAVDGIVSETFNGDNETTRIVTSNSDVTFTLEDGIVINRVGTHVREWLEGLETQWLRNDDKIQVTGSTQVETSEGLVYSRTVTSPLIRLGDCRHFVQGVVELIQNDVTIATLNFGDGECDNLATLTTDGETIEIELKDRMPKAKVERENGKSNKHSRGKGN